MKNFRVAVLANLKKNAPHLEGASFDKWDDLDSESTVEAICAAIRSKGNEAQFLEADETIIDTVRDYKPDICFNISEGHFGDSREAQIPAILEKLQIPYTGSKVLCLALTLDKSMTKRILAWHGLPTPEFQSFERLDEPLDEGMTFPLFVKPSREGTGMGISYDSIVHNEDELRKQLEFILRTYNQPALVEKFIEGREITVGMVGNLIGPVARRIPVNEDEQRIQAGLHFMPPMEVDLQPYLLSDGVYDNRLKTALAADLTYLCPAPIEEEMVDELNWLAAAVFRVTGALDVARVDFRLDINDNLKPYILEINPLPGLAPVISDLVIEAAAAGIDHTELVNMILYTALDRYKML
ncbi:MAG: D-alanine--D-alanine ligase [Chloroflexi bacterium]|nr:D-alanine--D-alanine ligase [Chloroflexota bacterium]